MAATVTAPAPQTTVRAAGWDTELFVLRGDDRAHLRERVLSLASSVERQPGVTLPECAASLVTELAPGGSRLTVVSGSPDDLLKKLRRAADRLADPKCKQIRDTAGVYYFDRPLYTPGSLALLFPGEGAQYTGMLADLCGVLPEVEDLFAWCDRLAEEAGRQSLRRLLHPAPSERDAAEAELRKLGPSIFGVLVADLAITQVLWNLQLPVSAIAGHSAGELAALLAAGALGSATELGPRLSETMDMMQRQEDEAGGPDVALLAVGAGKAAVDQVAASVADDMIVAMDNCPHQCVVVGPTPHIAAVESAILARGLVCERLPFRRPYHTPLFEPWMGPFRELFANVPFTTPHTPVYSCSTGAKFPPDPDAIRTLTVNHWVRPVEFTRMIETMYADGVRIFVEAGPRGNLSAFTEDILRGKSFVAIPANVPRKSGPTQINHLVAQLVAHHVPVNIGHLHAGRASERTRSVSDGVHLRSHPVAHTPGSPAQIMADYLGVMEQFLDVQREVMEAYLSGSGALAELDSVAHQFLPALFDLSSKQEPSPSPVAPQPETPPAPPQFALVGEVLHHEAGREIVFRRPLDLHEDLFVDDHTLGGRGVSHVDPGQNGLPVLPMTFSLEAMAEAASLLAPGKVVVAIRNVRLYRWVPYDTEPTTFEVRAAVSSADPSGRVEVRANVRDLSNSFLKDGANKPSSEATIVLADRYPESPQPLPFHLSDEKRCKSAVEGLRRNMFHGPLFQMVRTLDRYGKEGIEGTAEVQPRDRWFRSNPDPRVCIDPVLVDAAMHILGAWHLEQPDWSGRILLPIGVQSLEFFSPPPAVGTFLFLRGHNEEETARQARHGLEVFYPDGRLWYRLTGASYWRFYLPFGDVNFFGPKDQYFLSTRVPDAEPTSGRAGDTERRRQVDKTEQGGPASGFPSPSLPLATSASPRCYFLEPPLDLQQPVLRASGVRVTMTPRETELFRSLTCDDAARSGWFFTRLVAKDAVRAARNDRHGGGVFPADLETEVDATGRIVCRSRDTADREPSPPVAVAVVKGKVAAFSAFADRVGIGMLAVPKGKPDDEVRQQVAQVAVADALGISADGLSAEAGSTPGLFLVKHAGQRLRVQTARHQNTIIATTTCEAEPR